MIIATNQITIASLNDGVGIATTIVEYALSSSGTTPPCQILEDESHNQIVSNQGDPLTDGDWLTTVPNIPQGYYLWTRTRFVLSDGSFDIVYAVSYYSEDGQDGSSVSNVVPEYRLSNSRSSLTGSGAGYTWSEVKPECGENQYIWSRQKTTLSGPNGTTTVYSNAVCDIVLSDVVFDVNKANKSITEKVWQSDIESQINEYDGSTAQDIRDRVAQTETDINGINTTVSNVQSTLDTKADGSTVSTLSSQVSTLRQDVTGFKTTVSDTYATKADMNHFNVFIVGKQTGVTGNWIGTTNEISSLEDGQAITYWLPYNGSGNATLNLTLKDGTTTGAIPCYYSGASRLNTHYAAGNIIRLTYRTNVSIPGSNTISAGWWADANYNTNNYDRTKYNGVVKAAVNIPRYSIAVGTSAGFKPLNSGAAFNIEYPILYLQDGEIKQNESKANGYTIYPATITTTQALDLTPGLPLYIKGTLSGRTFTPISTAPITQTVPNSEDGKHYMFLGTAYGTATTVRTFYLLQDHPIYMYKGKGPLGGEDVGFVKIETAAMTIAEQTAEGFSWIVKSGSSQSSLTLTDSAMTAIAKDINLNGKVTFNSFNSELQTRIGNTESTLSNVVNNSTNQVVTYARNNSSTVAPTGTWYPNPEQTGSDPYLWQKTETKNINNVTTATQIVCITGQKGEPGVAGTSINTASVLLYQRATSAPSKPSGNITYTFDGGAVSGSLGSWQKTIPSGTNPCYVIVATASSTEATDIIAPSEWSNPVVLVQNGTNGAAANNQATILLYQRSATQPSKPGASITYTFSTGALSSTPSGWSRAVPAYQNNTPCWVTSATIISQNASASIAASAWSDVQKLVEDGNGIINTAVEYAISDSGSITPGIILADENGVPLKDDSGKFLVYGVWSSEPIDPPEGTYLWTKTTQTYSNGEVSVQYSCSKNAVGIKSCVQYYCLSQTQPSTTPLTDKINWSTTPQEYQVGMKYWSCQVTTFNDDTQTVSEIVQESTLDQALKASDIMKKWTDDALLEQVTINGGYIKAHTIETQHLATDAIMSPNYERTNANKFSTTGSYFDLENGNIFTPFFSVVNSPYAGSGLTVGASFKAGNPTPGNTGVEILPNGTLTAYGITVGGTIKAGAGEIAGFKIDSTSIRTNDVAVTSNANNSVSLSSANFARTINGAPRSGLRFAIGSKFGVTGTGAVYMSDAFIDGNTTVKGVIKASSGYIGTSDSDSGRIILDGTNHKIYYNISSFTTSNNKKGFYLGSDGIVIGKGFYVDQNGNTSIKMTGTSTSGTTYSFNVDGLGSLVASNANIDGHIEADSGKIGDWIIDSTGYLKNDENNPTVVFSPSSITYEDYESGSVYAKFGDSYIDVSGGMAATTIRTKVKAYIPRTATQPARYAYMYAPVIRAANSSTVGETGGWTDDSICIGDSLAGIYITPSQNIYIKSGSDSYNLTDCLSSIRSYSFGSGFDVTVSNSSTIINIDDDYFSDFITQDALDDYAQKSELSAYMHRAYQSSSVKSGSFNVNNSKAYIAFFFLNNSDNSCGLYYFVGGRTFITAIKAASNVTLTLTSSKLTWSDSTNNVNVRIYEII